MIQPDQVLAQRLVDGVLPGEEEREARARMARDPAFKTLVEELQRGRAFFAPNEADPPLEAAPPGFSSRVALAVRTGAAGIPDLSSLTRKLSWAAAALLFLSLSVLAGFQASRGGTVLRADDLVRRYEDLLQKARLQEGARKARFQERRKETLPLEGGEKKEGRRK